MHAALDRHTGRTCVLKIRREGAPSPPLKPIRAQILSTIEHPNLCRMVGVLEDGTQVVGRAHGPDIISWVRGAIEDVQHRGDVDLRRLRNGLQQITEGLSTLRDAGIHHGRLHPTNIRVDGAGRVCLMDYGLPNQEPGTPPGPNQTYVAPELRQKGQHSATGDLFSLGVILGEALLGSRPRSAEAFDAQPWCKPGDLVTLAKALMSQDPAERPNLDTVREALGVDRPPPAVNEDRYDLLDPIAEGAMGEVRRVVDRDLHRSLAMKIAHDHLQSNPKDLARFVAEAQLTAQLQHPGIVPVHEIGRLMDGRTYFTMKEIEGSSLLSVIRGFHSNLDKHQDKWSFHRLITMLHRVTEALAYAHGRGVLHRDIKPDNIMVGAYGEVLLVDWGIAKTVSVSDETTESATDDESTHDPVLTDLPANATRVGTVTGTPAYMAPELLSSVPKAANPQTDVYAMGATIYQTLSGRPPYEGRSAIELALQVRDGPPPPPTETSVSGRPIPPQLEELCLQAMARDPAERFKDADELALALQGWLDGAMRRAKALELVTNADAIPPRIQALNRRARVLDVEAAEALKDIPPSAPVSEKRQGWILQDEATDLRREAALMKLEYVQSLHAALHHDPELDEAHRRLADHYRKLHHLSELRRDKDEAAEHEVLLRIHDIEGQHEGYLRGVGRLSLVTEPAGAAVTLQPYEMEDRRLVPGKAEDLGTTPLQDIQLPMGSYMVELKAEGRHTVRYPVYIEREEHWDGIRPGATGPAVIGLPPQDEVPAGAVFVPPGWAWIGGDASALNSPFDGQWVWVDGLWVQRFAVSLEEYARFLDAQVEAGLSANELHLLLPQEKTATLNSGASTLLMLGPDGKHILLEEHKKDGWQMDLAAGMIDRTCAEAYARWWSAQTGRTWRLLTEIEWEKAARGVDGRFFPWGDGMDPSRCHMAQSHKGKPKMAPVESYPEDISPYGVRGMAGNMREWCWDNPQPSRAPRLVGQIAQAQENPELESSSEIVTRGGSWYSLPDSARCATRQWCSPVIRSVFIGMRLASPLRDDE